MIIYTNRNCEKFDMGIFKHIIEYDLRTIDRERGQERKNLYFRLFQPFVR
jgi:hypothetical protein